MTVAIFQNKKQQTDKQLKEVGPNYGVDKVLEVYRAFYIICDAVQGFRALGFRVLALRIEGLGLGIKGLGFRDFGVGFGVWGL